jgi:hypothetical protein
MIKVKAAHSDDERPKGGDPKKNKGLFICTKEGRNLIITAFLREQDASILKQMQRSPHRNQKCVFAMPFYPALTVHRVLET